MKTKLYKITLFFTVLLLSKAALCQYNLLFVGSAEESGDVELIAYLEGEGYTITAITTDDFKLDAYKAAAGYASYDAIFISEIVGSSDVLNYMEAGFPIPCVTTEGYAVRTNRWQFITNDDTEFKQASGGEFGDEIKIMVINNVDHYITKFYPENAEIAWTNKPDLEELGVTGSMLDNNVPDAIQLATYKDASMADFPTLWAIPENSTVTSSGVTIASRIVIFGAINPGLGEHASDGYYNIIKRSLEWVTNNYEEEPEPEPVNISTNEIRLNMLVFPNPATNLVTVTLNRNVTSVVISNLIGQKVAEFFPEGNKLTFETRSFASGIYFVSTENETVKLIIK